jgi:sulfate adenylyltransferase
LREKFGFNIFTIGRDHAGAENVYHPLSAINLVKKNLTKFKIQTFTHNGAYFCEKCDKIILKGECSHLKSLKEISGSEFRQNIMKNKSYKFARKEIHDILKKSKKKLFY